MSERFPAYGYDYSAEVFYVLPNNEKDLRHRYITYSRKLKGYPQGFKKDDFQKFKLKAWATVPLSADEQLDMSVYLSKNGEVEDFTMQYRNILDRSRANGVRLPLRPGYSKTDIHTLQIRTDYGHKNGEDKINHTNIELFDVFNNKINEDDEMSFVKQNFVIYNYESAIHYIFMQVEKLSPLIGPRYWLSPFEIHPNRVSLIHTLWQESHLSIPLCVLSRNVNIKMLQRIENTKTEILESDFLRIVKDEIEEARNVENIDSDNMRVVQLESNPSIMFLLPFPFFVPEENF